MNDEENIQDDSSRMFRFLLNPSRVLSQWYFGLGVWILLLGVLNLLTIAHPTQKSSWAGVLSLETLGTSFASDGYHPLSDTTFLLLPDQGLPLFRSAAT